jgi:hypothetical protein
MGTQRYVSRLIQGASSKETKIIPFPQAFLVELPNFRVRNKLHWKREKGTKLELNRILG